MNEDFFHRYFYRYGPGYLFFHFPFHTGMDGTQENGKRPDRKSGPGKTDPHPVLSGSSGGQVFHPGSRLPEAYGLFPAGIRNSVMPVPCFFRPVQPYENPDSEYPGQQEESIPCRNGIYGVFFQRNNPGFFLHDTMNRFFRGRNALIPEPAVDAAAALAAPGRKNHADPLSKCFLFTGCLKRWLAHLLPTAVLIGNGRIT